MHHNSCIMSLTCFPFSQTAMSQLDLHHFTQQYQLSCICLHAPLLTLYIYIYIVNCLEFWWIRMNLWLDPKFSSLLNLKGEKIHPCDMVLTRLYIFWSALELIKLYIYIYSIRFYNFSMTCNIFCMKNKKFLTLSMNIGYIDRTM